MDALEKIENDYRNKIFDSIVEGLQLFEKGDIPQYCGLEFYVPRNVQILTKPPAFNFLLYTTDFDISKAIDPPERTKGGYPIDNSLNLTYSFECPRSIITRDGRIYVTKQAFDDKRYDYLEELVPNILEDCKRIFEEGLTPWEVTKKYK